MNGRVAATTKNPVSAQSVKVQIGINQWQNLGQGVGNIEKGTGCHDYT